jgi:ATP-dependent HslUV protease ATP-binding subunit HslU
LKALTREDFRRILTEPEHSLLKQASALIKTEGVELVFDDSAVGALADLAAEINATVENIGARRLATVIERLLEDISFTASDRRGDVVTVDAAMVRERVATLAASADLSRYIL